MKLEDWRNFAKKKKDVNKYPCKHLKLEQDSRHIEHKNEQQSKHLHTKDFIYSLECSMKTK